MGLIAAVLALTTSSAASLPDVVTLTAVLEERGAPLDRAVVVTFSLWSAGEGGEALWADDARVVVVKDGVMKVEIGNGARPLPPHVFAQATWLDVVVDGVHMEPRLRIASAPHAIEATHAETCSMLGELRPDDVATRAMLDEVVDALGDDMNVAIDAIVAVDDVQWLRIYRRPAACGGGLALEGTCTSVPCAGNESAAEGLGLGFLDCTSQCASDVPRTCASTAVGWMRGS